MFLQALITFSCLIPTFLICARVVPNGLALIGAALLASTPVFLGTPSSTRRTPLRRAGSFGVFGWFFIALLTATGPDTGRLSCLVYY